LSSHVRHHHHREKKHPKTDHFWVVSVHSNAVRYESRWRLDRDFDQHMQDSGVKHVKVELAFGSRPFEVTELGNPYHVQIRCRGDMEIWQKENLQNCGVQRVFDLDPEVFGIATIDADVRFTRMNPFHGDVADWVNEACHQLEHHQAIQLWSHSIDLGPNHEVMAHAKSFCFQYLNDIAIPENKSYGYWHTGYAWAWKREALELLCGPIGNGPFLSFAPLGSADFYQGWALIGQLQNHLYQDVGSTYHRQKGFTPEYIRWLMNWQERAQQLKANIGCVMGSLQHFWHGNKIDRGYNTREFILIDGRFNPHTDIRYNRHGILELVVHSHRQIKMRDQIRAYYRKRNEDCNELRSTK
jgi:hypothetical protein